MSTLLGLLTSKIAGPIGAGLSLLLLILLLTSCGQLKAKDGVIRDQERRITSLRADLLTCQDNTGKLEASIAAQSASVAAFAEEQARRQREAETAVSEALRGRKDAEARAARLRAHQPQGVDLCARVVSADDAVLEALKP